MTTYVTKENFTALIVAENSLQYLMTSDNEIEFYNMVKELNLDSIYVCRSASVPFALLSKSKARLAKAKGALLGEEAVKAKETMKKILKYKDNLNET